MRGNVIVAAVVFGAAMIVSCLVLVFGLRWVANGATSRFEAAVAAHGRAVEHAGANAGAPISASLKDVAGAFDRPAQSIEHAGDKISHPQIPGDYTLRLHGRSRSSSRSSSAARPTTGPAGERQSRQVTPARGFRCRAPARAPTARPRSLVVRAEWRRREVVPHHAALAVV